MERVILLGCGILIVITTFIMLWQINERFLVTVPAHGGDITEGIIGTPRFINPILALTDADKDLSALVYSGLMKVSTRGLVPDIAERFEVSEDGTQYTFYLKKDLTFHDGEAVTSEDVIYTIDAIKDPLIKSPRESSFIDVTVFAPDEYTVIFTLEKPHTPFLENATIGILPKHIWSTLSPEQFSLSRNNIEPIGSGPYQITDVEEDRSGIPERYTLKAFPEYALGEPYITDLHIRFFPNEKSLLESIERRTIDSAHGISPESIHTLETQDLDIESHVLPRVFGVFFNQNQNDLFSYTEVREALSLAIDRDVLIESVLYGFGEPLNGPTPDDVVRERPTDGIQKAKALLEEEGWELNEEGLYTLDGDVLMFTITTTDIPELRHTAQMLSDTWRLIGADVDIDIFDTTALNQNVIRPRSYEALLFGEVIGRSRDLYPFWHSSGRNDPGLNIALYTNNRVDNLLEEMRETTDFLQWQRAYEEVRTEIITDNPALFLYAPKLIYIVPQSIQNFTFGDIGVASDRFATIHTWYTNTQRVWKIFVR